MDAPKIRESYDRAAPWYDIGEALLEVLGLRRLRRQLMGQATGRVLEVASGTGKNLRYLPRRIDWTGVDLSERMLARARRRSTERASRARVVVMDAQSLGFRDETFDTVVSSLSSCTFPDPLAALREMARVSRRDGRILLLEHGRSDHERVAAFQDRYADRHARMLGCHWNREPLALAHAAGLQVLRSRSYFLGIFTVIEAAPPGR